MKIEEKQAALMQLWQAMNKYENELRSAGLQFIAGTDEAGRGPLAGPVTAAAVILPENCYIPGLKDSKKLSEKQRLKLEEQIYEQALTWSCVSVDAETIDRINILEAARSAMTQAVSQLTPQAQHILTDAMRLYIDTPHTPLIKGDSLSVSIAAASIIAKNTRDRLMLEFDAQYPQYGFAMHKGYPTAAHRKAIKEFGPSPIHRRSFRLL